MDATTEAKVIKQTADAQAVILDKFRTLEQIIKANVEMTNALADIQYTLDTSYAGICARPENKDKPTAHINRVYKAEMATEHRFKKIVTGLKNTLKNMEYGGYR